MPVASVSQAAGTVGKFELSRPEVQLRLLGNADDLKGAVHLHVRRLAWTPPTNVTVTPNIQDINLDARIERDRIELSDLSLKVNGQPVKATGELPFPEDTWSKLIEHGQRPDWSKAHGHVTVANADLTALAGMMPDSIITEGHLNVDVTLAADGAMQGQLTVTNAATKPLSGIGPIRQIDLALKLDNRSVALQQMTALVGGATVKAKGEGTFNDFAHPEFNATLQGTNVALVRKPGMIVRSDLNLRLAAAGGQPPTISGDVKLRDSLYLQDLDLLSPGPGAAPEQRPPYFSIPSKPLGDWRLDIRINGDKFMRVRTPIFAGVVSANFRLQNTLRDPIATGDASIDSGKITFPFGLLSIDNGLVTLNSDAPHTPKLSVNASGNVYDYTIKLQVGGTAEEPQVVFSSTPPLNSGQILLLLTAGELPQRSSYFSTKERAETLMMFLGKDLLSRIMGSESATERLTVKSGEYISESGKSTYSIEYHFTDRWSILGEYDRFDSLNAYLKWKVFSK